MLATTASTGISILQSTPSLFTTLQDHSRILRTALDDPKLAQLIHVPSDALSPLIHIQLAGEDPTDLEGIDAQERLLQDVVDEALLNGVLLTRTRRLRGQETFEARPSLKICVCASLTKKEIEKSAGVVKSALIKVLGKRR